MEFNKNIDLFSVGLIFVYAVLLFLLLAWQFRRRKAIQYQFVKWQKDKNWDRVIRLTVKDREGNHYEFLGSRSVWRDANTGKRCNISQEMALEEVYRIYVADTY